MHIRKISIELFVILICCICFIWSGSQALAKKACDSEYVKTIGSFKYTYRDYNKGIWITNIAPTTSKGLERLEIPGWLNGKKVIKLGDGGDVDDMEMSWDDSYNIFGQIWNEDYPCSR